MRTFQCLNLTFSLCYVVFACLACGVGNVFAQQVATIFEDCSEIKHDLMKNSRPTHTYEKLPCEDVISLINKVCKLVQASSKVKAFTTCSSSKMLKSFLNKVGLKHAILYDGKCTTFRNAQWQNFEESPNPLHNFIFDAVDYFHLRTTVVIIDSYTGISTWELQKMLSSVKTAAYIVDLDSEDDIEVTMDKNFRRGNRFRNFIIACGEHHLKSVIQHAEEEELLNFPLFWLIITDNATRVAEIMVEVKVDYTWNITVAEAVQLNDEEKFLSHRSVFTVIDPAHNSEVMDRTTAACNMRRFSDCAEPQILQKPNDAMAESMYTLYFYRVKCEGMLDIIPFGNWSRGLKFMTDTIDPATRMSLEGCNFTIALGSIMPYVMFDEQNASSVRGLDVDILKILAKKLKFSYSFILTNYTTMGNRLDDGNWTNVFKILTEDKTVDFILPTVDVTPARSAAMHFTARLTEITGTVIIRTPNLNADMDDYIRPFSVQVWFVLALCILVVTVCLTLTYLVSPFGQPKPGYHDEKYNKYPTYGWWNSFFTTCSSILQQGTDSAPRYVSGRIILATILATSVLIIQSYSSLLISFLTTNMQKTPFKNVQELAENRDYSIGMIALTNYEELLEISDDEHLISIRKKIASNKDNVVKTLQEGLDKVMREKYAFLVPDTAVNRLLRKNCSYMAPITNILKSFKCIAARKHFPYISTFSTVINILRETGVIDQLYHHYLPDIKSTCQDKMEHQQIDFFNILSLIYLFAAGIGISIVMIAIECCIHQYRKWSLQKQLTDLKTRSRKRPLPYVPKTLTRPKLNTIYFANMRSTQK